MPFAEHEAVALLRMRLVWVEAQDAVVEHPEHIQGRVGCGLVLVVTGRECHQAVDVFKGIGAHTVSSLVQQPARVSIAACPGGRVLPRGRG
jgi:hypothetical protein